MLNYLQAVVERYSGIVAVLALLGVLGWRAARRFEQRQMRLGRWDKHGPLVETAPPPSRAWNYAMEIRLEVVNKWRGWVRRRRLPNEEL
jgi:hypothetical protein